MAILRQEFGNWTKGVNKSFAVDLLQPSELLSARNARPGLYGDIKKRSGSQRIHTDQLGSGNEVNGLFQWDSPSGSQIVAVCNGNLYHKLLASSTFTEVSTSISTTQKISFIVYRDSDATPTLYFCDGTTFYKWDGTTLNTVEAPEMDVITVYHNRVYGASGKWIYWSALFDPEEWSASAGAGSGRIETYDADAINNLMVLGGSLLMYKEDNISRLTGYDKTDVDIDTETEGVSSEIGLIAPFAIARVEDVCVSLSDRGAIMATESAVRSISINTETVWDAVDKSAIADSVAAHNRYRREVLFFVPGSSGDTTNTTIWKYNYRLNAWWGPDDFQGFDACTATRYERSDGSESVMVGGYDGYIRDIDVDAVGGKDDVLYGGTGGEDIPMVIQLPDLTFGDAHRFKIANLGQLLVADLGESGQAIVRWNSDNQEGKMVRVPSKGDGRKQYVFRPSMRGRRVEIYLEERSSTLASFDSLVMKARLGRARYV